ncbi:hypothetical protein [Macromonas bipunctata]|uniref:hypothetical protein n=1 Tax=Macromonas bipunctata TaxID=183670 RepID=UPI000C34A225|nr:hypothetical protein [Macromonas bipunctata]
MPATPRRTVTAPQHPHQPPARPGRWHGVALAALLVGGAALAPVASAQSVRCHLTYAGATRSFTVPPAMCPDEVAPVLEGASFVFKVTNLAQPARKAGVDIEVLTRDRKNRLQPTHKAHYKAWEASTSQPGVPHGFTGQQTVRGVGYSQGLSYWCERLLDKPAVLRPCGGATPAALPAEAPPAPVPAETPAVSAPEMPAPAAEPPAMPIAVPTEPAPVSQVPVALEMAAMPQGQVLPFHFISPSGGLLVPVMPQPD